MRSTLDGGYSGAADHPSDDEVRAAFPGGIDTPAVARLVDGKPGSGATGKRAPGGGIGAPDPEMASRMAGSRRDWPVISAAGVIPSG
jgi:hypothetical protein